MEQGVAFWLQLLVYPVVSVVILLGGLFLIRPLKVSRNKPLCLALAILTGTIAATVFYVEGAGVVWWAAHNYSESFTLVVSWGWLIGVPAVAILTAWLTYRKAMGRTSSALARSESQLTRQ